MYGKRQIFPNPTAEPTVAKINEYLDVQLGLSTINIRQLNNTDIIYHIIYYFNNYLQILMPENNTILLKKDFVCVIHRLYCVVNLICKGAFE